MESCGDVSWEHLLEEPEDLSDRPVSCELVRVVPDVIDVPELCDVHPVGPMWNLWNRSPPLSPKKRAHCCADTQEEMRYEGSTVITHPL